MAANNRKIPSDSPSVKSLPAAGRDWKSRQAQKEHRDYQQSRGSRTEELGRPLKLPRRFWIGMKRIKRGRVVPQKLGGGQKGDRIPGMLV